jgi:hypothetical protein
MRITVVGGARVSRSTSSFYEPDSISGLGYESELGAEQPSFIEGCQRDWDQLPRPDPPLIVGLDSGYVPARHPQSRTEGSFEVIAGKILREEGDPKCFAFVPNYDTKPKRRLFEALKSQGLQMNQRAHDAAHRDGLDDDQGGWRRREARLQSRPTKRRTGWTQPRWTSSWRA